MEQQTRVGIVGLGYVGLPLALTMQSAGYDVVGLDIDADKIETLHSGESTVSDVTDDRVAEAVRNGLTLTTDYEDLADVDGVSICVPTPLRKTDAPDLSFVVDAVERLATVVPEGCTIILESTVYPGATKEVVSDIFEDTGMSVGEDVYLAFSPERIDPGNDVFSPTDIPKVLGGVTPECGTRAEALYSPVFEEIVRVGSATEAEFVKLLENTFRAVNIGLINELAQIAHQLDVDIWDTIEAAKTKPFGFMPFYPGPGLGGHCIPVDPLYLSWKADQQGIDTRFISLADTVNREMPDHVVRRVVKLLNERGVSLSNSDVFIVGVSYKKDVSDVRESPAIDIIAELEDWDANIQYHDPHVPEVNIGEQTFTSVPPTPGRVSEADCVLLLTDHTAVDIDAIVDAATLVFDTRNATKGAHASHVVRL
ncbi:nucleotide sugar dehydrogenase [Halobaculum sp. MBLA0147]|uniref:nucleotide sugar dehydrogenase n=1 Tax=Halobaculum sp. MBLA0147 TaxID=3079934 RepID=UPI003525AD90